MSIRTFRRSTALGVAVTAMSVLALSACGSSGGGSAPPTSTSTATVAPITKDASLAALVPAQYAPGRTIAVPD